MKQQQIYPYAIIQIFRYVIATDLDVGIGEKSSILESKR